MLQLLFTCLTQTIIDHTVHIAGATLIQLLFSNFAIAVVTADLQLVHAVRMLGEQSLEFVNQNPGRRFPDVLVHCRRNTADHPAITVTATNLCTNLLCFRAVPQLIPSLIVQVAHNFLILGAIARHNIAIRIDEEGVKTHVARKQTLLTVDIVDQTVVKVCTEPLFRAIATEQFIDQILKVFSNHWAVVDDVLGLNEVEAVVQGGGGEFHPHLIRQAVEGDEVGGVLVLHGHAESHILHAHLPEFFQGGVAAVVTVGEAAYLVVGLLEALDGDADADVGELFAQIEDTVGEEAVGGDDDAVRLLPQLPHDVLQIRADKGLAAGDVGKIHGRQLADGLEADLFLGLRGCLIAVAHGAARVAAVRYDYGSVEFLLGHGLGHHLPVN